jgi:Cu2+-containing amine oxidase
VVNYEYLFYWYLLQDGTIEYEIKLSGMLSTNMLSAGEGLEPRHGTLVAPVGLHTSNSCKLTHRLKAPGLNP